MRTNLLRTYFHRRGVTVASNPQNGIRPHSNCYCSDTVADCYCLSHLCLNPTCCPNRFVEHLFIHSFIYSFIYFNSRNMTHKHKLFNNAEQKVKKTKLNKKPNKNVYNKNRTCSTASCATFLHVNIFRIYCRLLIICFENLLFRSFVLCFYDIALCKNFQLASLKKLASGYVKNLRLFGFSKYSSVTAL